MEHRPDVPAESPHRARATVGVERVKRGLAASGEIASAIVSRLMDRDLTLKRKTWTRATTTRQQKADEVINRGGR
jgi:hypothetical protein